MAAAEAPEWIVREDATLPVLVALYLRQVLGIRFPEELPHLRGVPPRSAPISIRSRTGRVFTNRYCATALPRE